LSSENIVKADVESADLAHWTVKRVIFHGLQNTLTLFLPVLLTLIAVRLIMTPLFLRLEYQRPGFPDDPFGLTTEDRLYYAPYALNYLLNSADISYLSDLTFPDGMRLFNSRELRHMHDVKSVTRFAFQLLTGITVATVAISIILLKNPANRFHVKRGIFNGAILTLGLIVSVTLVALVSWNTFFVDFHQLFFSGESWLFAYSDTLIRLFPEQFWFDASLAIGGLTTLMAGVLLAVAWRWKPAAQH